MTEENHETESKKSGEMSKGFDVSKLFSPITTVSTTLGTLYFYSLRTTDLSKIAALPETDALTGIRSIIPYVASLVETKNFREERQAPSIAEISRLEDSEVEKIAERYLENMWVLEQDEATDRPQRETDEDAASYLNRLLRYEAENQRKKIHEFGKKTAKSATGIFDEVRRSSSLLASTLDSYNKVAASHVLGESHQPSFDHNRNISEQFARQRRERTEELEMVRLTAKMTADSARTLNNLAEAATTLLEQLNERDRRADKTTRSQIALALWSVGISAVLALIALIVALFGYFQDRSNNEAGDKWQAELLQAVVVGNKSRADSEQKILHLQEEFANLNSHLRHKESVSRSKINKEK